VGRKNKSEAIPLVKWYSIEKPKKAGGWGLKNIHHFWKALVASVYEQGAFEYGKNSKIYRN